MYHEKNNYAKTNKAYQALFSCLNNKAIFSRLHPEVKQAIVRNIGQFERKESTNLLEPLLYQLEETIFFEQMPQQQLEKVARMRYLPLIT